MGRPKRTKIEVNNKKSLTELMQDAYNDANNQISQSQRIVNQLEQKEDPDDDIENTAKINREKVNALKIRDSAIKTKTDLARLQSEIIKNEGDENKALDDAEDEKVGRLNFQEIRKMVNQTKNESGNESENKGEDE